MTDPTRTAAFVIVALALGACAPALNWRDVRPEASGAQLLFPCKPDTQERRVALAGPPVRMALLLCEAAGQTWALAQADVADPSRVAPALAAMQAGAAANVGGRPAVAAPYAVAGATPQPGGGRSRLQGQRSDGQPVQLQSLVFARGTLVFQASVLGTAVSEEAAEAYFSSIRFPP
jgi:hypothetical protein